MVRTRSAKERLNKRLLQKTADHRTLTLTLTLTLNLTFTLTLTLTLSLSLTLTLIMEAGLLRRYGALQSE